MGHVVHIDNRDTTVVGGSSDGLIVGDIVVGFDFGVGGAVMV